MAAIRAGQLGMKVAVVERDEVGGICLNWGCIPSKALLRNAEVLNLVRDAKTFGISFDNLQYDFGAAIDRSRQVVKRLTGGVDLLLKKNKVAQIKGSGVLKDSKTVEIAGAGRVVSADSVIIATGARDREFPSLPVDREVVITSREALELRDVPPRVVIVGGGATGAEFAHIYRSYGAEVTIIELLSRLIPQEDEEISAQLERAFRKQGIAAMTGAGVQGIAVADGKAGVTVSSGGSESVIECDRVLVAVGVQGNIDGIGLDSAGVETERGFVVIDDEMKTNVPGIYAIGDVTGKMLLAHVASGARRHGCGISGRIEPRESRLRVDAQGNILQAPGGELWAHGSPGPRAGVRRQDRQVPLRGQRQSTGPRGDRRHGKAGRGRRGRRGPGCPHDRLGGHRATGRARPDAAARGHDHRAGLVGAPAPNHLGGSQGGSTGL